MKPPFKRGDSMILTKETVAQAVEYWLNKGLLNSSIDQQTVAYISTQDEKGKFISGIRVEFK